MVRYLCSVALIVATISGCGSVTKNGVAGGAVGAGVGAGTGALVGSVIANGDVVGSALLGGAIGIPAGIVLGVALSAYDSQVQEDKLLARYISDQETIIEQEREIERLRAEVVLDAPHNPLYNHGARKPFAGITLGR